MAVANIVTLDPTDTFSDWLNKTNELVEHLRDHTVTAEVSAFANTDGNARLNGELVANTVWIADNLTGGALAIDGVGMDSADLSITSNTVFTGTADLVTVTNQTLMIGDVEARSNVSVTGLAGSTRIEGANIDFLTTGARLSTVRTDEDGSLFIGADAGNTGVANTHIVLSTDGITALEIDQRDVRFSNNLGTLQNFVWDSTNERLGIHTAAPTVELDVTGNTHTTDLTVHTDATIDNNLSVANTATIDKLNVVQLANTNTLNIRSNVVSDIVPSTAMLDLGNTTSSWLNGYIANVTSTNVTTDNLFVGTGANKASIAYTTNTARTYTIPNVAASSFVMTEGAQTINGTKTFGSSIVLPAQGTTGTTVAVRADRSLTILGGTDLTSNQAGSLDLTADRSWTISHDEITRTNGSNAAATMSANTSVVSFTNPVDGVTVSATGHVTGTDDKTWTIPAANTTAAGVVSSLDQSFGGTKTFSRIEVTNLELLPGGSFVIPDTVTYSSTTVNDLTVLNSFTSRIASSASSASQIPVFITNPDVVNGAQMFTRTPAQLRSDIGAVPTSRSLTISGGTYLSSNGTLDLTTDRTWTINHDTTNRSAETTTASTTTTTSTTATFSSLDSVTSNGTGHVTASARKNWTIPAATTTAAGVMTSADKSKLNGIAAGAQVNVPPGNGTLTLQVNGTTATTFSANQSSAATFNVPAAGTGTNGIVTTGTQSFAGTKTFINTINASITGNAGTVSNGVYTSRTLTVSGGDGISISNAAQTLAANRSWTVDVDSTVVRTTGDQQISGYKQFTGNSLLSNLLTGTSISNANYCSSITSSDSNIWGHASRNTKDLYSAIISSRSAELAASSQYGSFARNTIISSHGGHVKLINYMGDGQILNSSMISSKNSTLEDCGGGSFSAQRWADQNVIIGSDSSHVKGGVNNAIIGSTDSNTGNTSSYAVRGTILGSRSCGIGEGGSTVVIGSKSVFTEDLYSIVMGYHASSEAQLSSNRTIKLDAITGNISAAGTITPGSTFSDFAEMFPNSTGTEIQPGIIVTLDGNAVRPANPGDIIAGVVSHTAALLAGDSPFCWAERYSTDDWGRKIFEEIEDPDRPGKMIKVQKENPDWTPEQPQIKRSDRPDEWTPVGLIGQVRVCVDETVLPMTSVGVSEGGIGTESNEKTGIRCMKIIKEYNDTDKYAIALCLLNIHI